jgi:hypothetical protein
MVAKVVDLVAGVTWSEIRRLAVEADACPESVVKVLSGRDVRGAIGKRIKALVLARGWKIGVQNDYNP